MFNTAILRFRQYFFRMIEIMAFYHPLKALFPQNIGKYRLEYIVYVTLPSVFCCLVKLSCKTLNKKMINKVKHLSLNIYKYLILR